MAHSPQMSDYILFMQWFQDVHPDLYTRCWQTIAVPVNEGQVTLETEGIPVLVVKQLVDTLHEYYTKDNP